MLFCFLTQQSLRRSPLLLLMSILVKRYFFIITSLEIASFFFWLIYHLLKCILLVDFFWEFSFKCAMDLGVGAGECRDCVEQRS
jgi:hypothetical protein